MIVVEIVPLVRNRLFCPFPSCVPLRAALSTLRQTCHATLPKGLSSKQMIARNRCTWGNQATACRKIRLNDASSTLAGGPTRVSFHSVSYYQCRFHLFRSATRSQNAVNVCKSMRTYANIRAFVSIGTILAAFPSCIFLSQRNESWRINGVNVIVTWKLDVSWDETTRRKKEWRRWREKLS